MARDEALRIKGYKEFLRATDHADKAVKKEVRSILRGVGDIVRDDARRRIEATSQTSAAGYHTVVRARGVAVEARRKTTGDHPEYGGYQMRHAFLPALEASEGRLYHEMKQAVDLIADVFEYGSY